MKNYSMSKILLSHLKKSLEIIYYRKTGPAKECYIARGYFDHRKCGSKVILIHNVQYSARFKLKMLF